MPEDRRTDKRKWRRDRMKSKKKTQQRQETTERVLRLLVVFVYCDRDRWRLSAGPLQTAS